MKQPAVRESKTFAQALGTAFATAKARTLHIAHCSKGGTHSSVAAEHRAAWLSAHSSEFVNSVENACVRCGADGGSAEHEWDTNSTFDAVRLYLADKLDKL